MNKKDIHQKLLDFKKRHTDDITFNMKIKRNGGIHVKYYSRTAKNNGEELADAVTGTITAIVKILKEHSDNPTQEQVLEPFKIAVAKEFGVTKEEYYKEDKKAKNTH